MAVEPGHLLFHRATVPTNLKTKKQKLPYNRQRCSGLQREKAEKISACYGLLPLPPPTLSLKQPRGGVNGTAYGLEMDPPFTTTPVSVN